MNKQQSNQEKTSFIFNIEVLLEGEHHAIALEQLLRSLNQCGFLDYRILSGIQLGQIIDQRKKQPTSIQAIPVDTMQPDEKEVSTSTTSDISGVNNVQIFMKNNTLIRLLVNKGLGITLSIPCRIINIDEQDQLITIYHVDENQVYSFRLNEIEDIIE